MVKEGHDYAPRTDARWARSLRCRGRSTPRKLKNVTHERAPSSYIAHNARILNIISNNKIFARCLDSDTTLCEQHAICTPESGHDISKALVYME